MFTVFSAGSGLFSRNTIKIKFYKRWEAEVTDLLLNSAPGHWAVCPSLNHRRTVYNGQRLDQVKHLCRGGHSKESECFLFQFITHYTWISEEVNTLCFSQEPLTETSVFCRDVFSHDDTANHSWIGCQSVFIPKWHSNICTCVCHPVSCLQSEQFL